MESQSSRRNFVRSTVAAAGAACLGRAQSMGGPKASRVKSSIMLWTLKGSSEQQVATAAEAGVQSVELVTEYVKWSRSEADSFRSAVQSHGMGVDALLNSYDWTKRPVTMVNPDHQEGFLADLRNSIEWAHRLGCSQIIAMSGNEQPNLAHEKQYGSMVEAAKRGADLAAAGDVVLILENLNSKVNHKGYFLTSASESLRCVKEVDHPHLRMLFDIYHEAVQHGDPIPVLLEAEPYVAVFHVADEPGRNDPGTGQMKWDEIYKAIGRTSYSGYIALEYLAKGDELTSLRRALTQMRRDLNASTSPAV